MPDSHAKTMLTKIEAFLEGHLDAAVQEYTIAGRAIKKIPLNELMDLRDRYKAEYAAEQTAKEVAAGSANKNKAKVQFT